MKFYWQKTFIPALNQFRTKIPESVTNITVVRWKK